MEMEKDLVMRQLGEGSSAKRLFNKLLGTSSPERSQLLAIIGEQPEAALAALAKGEVSTGLTVRGTANILDDVLGTIADPAKARGMLEAYFSQEQTIELIAAHADRDSVVEQIASFEDVITAVLRDLQVDAPPLPRKSSETVPSLKREAPTEHPTPPTDSPRTEADTDGVAEDELTHEEGDQLMEEAEAEAETNEELEAQMREFPITGYFTLVNWATKLKDREDFDKFLNYQLAGASILDHLLIHVWNESGQPSNAQRVEASRLDEAGIDVEEGYARLKDLLASEDDLPRLDQNALEDARLELSERKRRIEALPLVAQAAEDAQSSLVEASKHAF